MSTTFYFFITISYHHLKTMAFTSKSQQTKKVFLHTCSLTILGYRFHHFSFVLKKTSGVFPQTSQDIHQEYPQSPYQQWVPSWTRKKGIFLEPSETPKTKTKIRDKEKDITKTVVGKRLKNPNPGKGQVLSSERIRS